MAGTLNEKIGESGPVKVHLSDPYRRCLKAYDGRDRRAFHCRNKENNTERIRNHSDMAKTMAVFRSTSVFGRYQSYFVFYFD